MVEQEKQMDRYTIQTFGDILRALREHPEWLEELRKLILTTELLELPKKIEALIRRCDTMERRMDRMEQDIAILKKDVAILKKDVAVLKQDVAVLKQDVAVLKQDVAVLKQDVAVLKKDMAYLKGEFGRFKGSEFERTIRERYPAYLGHLLRRSSAIPISELAALLEQAEESGKISQEDRIQALQLDLVVRGITEKKHNTVLAIEISYSVFEDDLRRALERAAILKRALEEKEQDTIVAPLVIGVQISKEIAEQAKSLEVLLLQTTY